VEHDHADKPTSPTISHTHSRPSVDCYVSCRGTGRAAGKMGIFPTRRNLLKRLYHSSAFGRFNAAFLTIYKFR